ncbi:MAG: ADP-ribosylation/crystallin J1, partial [Pseudomonadota bacterium]
AEKIARDWNSKSASPLNEGFVTRFEIAADLAARYPVEVAGGVAHRELWVPAEELDAFNAGIVGEISVVAGYRDGARVDLADIGVPR